MIRVGPYEFTSLAYDDFNDQLTAYLDGHNAGVGKSTPELHVWYYAEKGSDEVIGLFLIGPRLLLERFGAVHVTLPSGEKVEAKGVAEYLEGRG